ncbi:MAG: penicillin-binding protein 2 [Alphaproteobacteria bacterium]|nr:penicillin-binding protein 2 [Alphaproteobacteria bacterium]
MKRTEARRGRLFTRRALVLGGLQAAAFSALAGRLYQLQVVDADRYALLADENRINLQLLPLERGLIFDRFGQPLAANQLNYSLVLVPEQTGSVTETLEALRAFLPLWPEEEERIRREAKRKRSFMPITVRENLSWDEVARIEVNMPDLPGLSVEVGQRRYYAFGALASHVVGYVGAVSEKDIEGNADPVLSLPGFRIGKNGCERTLESALRGRAGSRQVEVNAYGRVIRELARDNGVPGDDHILSLDMGLQEYVCARLADHSASCVVIDVVTGEVLALASVPAYDSNVFAGGVSNAEWDELVRNPRMPLFNKACAGQYPPGSTFKVVVALAALEAGVMPMTEKVFCPGFMRMGNTQFYCWKKGGHGSVAMVEGIMQSCDVYFYEVARRVGIDNIAAMSRRFGLGEIPQVGLPGEKPGLVPTAKWKLATYGVPWQNGDTVVVGIGQGYMLTTPMQLAVMAARIANGIYAVKPTLVHQVQHRKDATKPMPREFDSLGLKPEHMALVREGMIRVTNDSRGTAYRARIEEQEYAMAGKTGSVQVKRISKAERDRGVIKNEDRPWKDRDHALFVGYAPVSAPRYAVSVVVEHGGSGSVTAAPIARDVLREAQRRDSARDMAATWPLSGPVTRAT